MQGRSNDPAFYERFGFRSDQRVRLDGVPAGLFDILPFQAVIPGGRVDSDR